MAEHEDPQPLAEEEEDDYNPSYKAPAPKSLDEIKNLDTDDESLVKYKEKLLGGAGNFILDAENTNKVIIQKLSLLVDGRDEVFLDLTMPKEQIKKQSFTLKEGVIYKIKIYFYVQREIVSGLRYEHRVNKTGLGSALGVEKMKQMMGSYGPRAELQSFTTQGETAPMGMLMRGDYKIASRFVDDDAFEYVHWEWHLSVKKDW